ncbi:hypothetical protein J5N97_021791 [Dioscorea zingiberensis]|uniref:Cyanobacterial aminoacyl-tRNA synthetase CAAD domain-containing protein n=1 Tax=Dioscorea zingiberensis TaxID=325984 RepID=A0A9D5HA11_9LILI|nr:hypothetical protein J5N97_021791 [Dioscorea zingiberensis]
MASAASTTTCALTSPAPADSRVPARSKAPQAIGLPSLHPPPNVASQGTSKALSAKRFAQNFVAMATGEAPAAVSTELPEFVKTVQEAWDKVEDKYAVSSLAFAGTVGLWGTVGMISAIDRLPVVPGLLEIVGIGYSGWFAYRNLINKTDREALFAKIKGIYRDIIGTSSTDVVDSPAVTTSSDVVVGSPAVRTSSDVVNSPAVEKVYSGGP